jgi:hypothetical protein
MFKYVMGLIDKVGPKSKKPKIEFTLNTDEIQIILQGIQNSTYKGKDIEMMYNLVLKLQNLYTKSLDNK